MRPYLKLQGTNVSSPTIQGILIKHGMGSRYERLLRLEEKVLEQQIELTLQQVAKIEKANPAFKKRHVESSRPGELLRQDTFFVGTLKGVGKVYLHTVVDTFGSQVFGFLHTSKQPEAAVAMLHNDVVPFYQSQDIQVEKILTDNGREFCGKDTHPYELYLQLNEIKHKASFPTPQAARKLLYLTTMNITRKWSTSIFNWPLILNQLAIRFEDRWPQ